MDEGYRTVPSCQFLTLFFYSERESHMGPGSKVSGGFLMSLLQSNPEGLRGRDLIKPHRKETLHKPSLSPLNTSVIYPGSFTVSFKFCIIARK